MTSMGMMTFTQMVTAVGRLVNDPSTGRQVQIKDALNSAYMFAASTMEWDQLLVADETGLRKRGDSTLLTFESGEAEAPMPWGAQSIRSLQYQSISTSAVEMVTPGELFERAGSQLSTSGRPCYACVAGRTAQYQRLPAAEAMKFKAGSTNANLVARVHYLQSTGHIGNENFEDLTTATWTSLVMSGGVQAAGWPITRVSLPSTWANVFQGYRNDGTTLILEIDRSEIPVTATNSTYLVADRPLLRLWPVPDKDYAMTVVYYAMPQRMTEDEDQPIMPVADFLTYKAAATVSRIKGDHSSAGNFDSEAGASLTGVSRGEKKFGRAQAVPFRGNFLHQTGM